MSGKALFLEFSPQVWIDVIKRLHKERGWKPCYWTYKADSHYIIKEAFPDVITQASVDAIRGIRPQECPDYGFSVLDQDIINKLAPYESTVFGMMDRMDTGGVFTYGERVRLYHTHIRYWLSVLEYYKPNVVFFSSSPHVVFDYVVYRLCKIKNIKTIVMMLAVEGFFYAIEDFEQEPDFILSLYKKALESSDLSRFKLSNIMQRYWDKVRSPYSVAIPFDAKEIIDKDRRPAIGAFIKRKAKAIFKYIRFIYQPALPNYMKLKNRAIEDSEMTYLKYVLLCKFKAERKKKKLKQYYESLAQKVSLVKPYIYVALHYQPEKSTLPDGGAFTHQLLMIQMLSRAIPKDWSIYIKEHAIQFSPNTAGERCRDKYFYKDLLSLSNVKLVPMSTSPFDLIDNSQAVATVTGTSGLEAVIRGKPVLAFGYSWYRGCEGIFYTPTLQHCKEVISKIENNYKVDSHKVRLYLYALEKECSRGYTEPCFEKISNMSHEDNIDAIIKAVYKVA